MLLKAFFRVVNTALNHFEQQILLILITNFPLDSTFCQFKLNFG